MKIQTKENMKKPARTEAVLSDDEVPRMHAYWRVANYVSVGQCDDGKVVADLPPHTMAILEA
jgi:phosphoketolase